MSTAASAAEADFIRDDADPRDADIDFVVNSAPQSADVHPPTPVKAAPSAPSTGAANAPRAAASPSSHKATAPPTPSARRALPDQSALSVCTHLYEVLAQLDMLHEYGAAFAREDVKFVDVLLLSDTDLAQLVPKLGPRRRLVAACAAQTASPAIAIVPAVLQNAALERAHQHLAAAATAEAAGPTSPGAVHAPNSTSVARRPTSAAPAAQRLSLNTAASPTSASTRPVSASLAPLTPQRTPNRGSGSGSRPQTPTSASELRRRTPAYVPPPPAEATLKRTPGSMAVQRPPTPTRPVSSSRSTGGTRAASPASSSRGQPPPPQFFAVSPLAHSYSQSSLNGSGGASSPSRFNFPVTQVPSPHAATAKASSPPSSLSRSASQASGVASSPPPVAWLPTSRFANRPASASGSATEARLVADHEDAHFRLYRAVGSPGLGRVRPQSASERVMYPKAFEFGADLPAGAVLPQYSSPDECLNCTFAPRVSREVLELDAAPFMERVQRDVETFIHVKKHGNPLAESKTSDFRECTFEPKLPDAILQYEPKGGGAPKDFVERMLVSADKLQARTAQKMREYESTFTFEPFKAVPNSPLAARPISPPMVRDKPKDLSFAAFYDRCQSDIAGREARLRAAERPASLSAQCTFEPTLTPKLAAYKPKAPFLQRMLSHIEEQREKFADAQAEKERQERSMVRIGKGRRKK